MNDKPKHSSPTTISRISALNKILRACDSTEAVLWLADNSWGEIRLLTSYYLGPNQEAAEELQNSFVEMDPSHIVDTDDCKVPRSVVESLSSLLSRCTFDPLEFTFFSLTHSTPFSTTTSEQPFYGLLGVLAVKGMSPPALLDRIWLEDLSKEILLGRFQRFDHAVHKTQSLLSEVNTGVDQSLMAIGHLVKSEIGAQRSVYRNRNTLEGWLEIIDAQISESEPEGISISFSNDSDPTSLRTIQKRMAVILNDEIEESSVELLTIPFLQPGYRLKETSFVEGAEFLNQLEVVQSNDFSLIFFGKKTSGYLQDCFSDTDMKIASSVFGFIEKYASARIFEENSSAVSQFLKEKALEHSSVEEILRVLETLSIRFKNLFLLKVDEVQASFQIEYVGANPSEILSDSYLKRLKRGYLKKFYSHENGYHNDSMYVGVERTEDGFDLEVHFPSEKEGSKLFVARYVGSEISQSILRSFINLFNELFIRDRKAEHQNDRANYLMQVRHAVIHHFAAAHRSLKSIRPIWEKGSKNKEYWLDILHDPLIASEFSRGLNSLGQANLIIENGRFILGDVDPSSLNRKPYRITETIKNVLEVLQDNRDEKGLVVISKITGDPPKVMNADEPLMSIALMNLFDNAMKYAPYHTKLRWQIEYKSDRLRFSISSVGEYLDPARKHLLFQVGFRGKQKDRLNQRHGTGLGLPVAYRILRAHSPIAELHYEAIGDTSDLGGVGTTFYFDMPYLTGQTSKKAVTE